MKKIGIIGNPLKQSISEKWFENYFAKNNIEAVFQKHTPTDFEIKNFKKWVIDNNWNGLLITIPFKKEILPFCDILDEAAKKIGAVNIIAKKEKKIIGYNIDWLAFEKELFRLNLSKTESCVLCGNGGAASAVEYALSKNQIRYRKFSRTKIANCELYINIEESFLKNSKLIINATPLGMKPYENEYPPINYNVLSNNTFAFDLIYTPTQTIFLKKCEEQGCKTSNGLRMVENVYEKAAEIFEL